MSSSQVKVSHSDVKRPKYGPLLVLDSSYPSTGGGGAESQVGTLGRWFNGNGYPTILVTPMLSDSRQIRYEEIDGLPVRRLSYPQIPILGAAILQLKLALVVWRRRKQACAIHVHIGSWMAVTCSLMGKVVGLPVVVKMTGKSELDGGPLDLAGGFLARVKRAGLRHASAYQAISGEIDRAINAVGLPSEKSLRIANAVDLKQYGLRAKDGAGDQVFPARAATAAAAAAAAASGDFFGGMPTLPRGSEMSDSLGPASPDDSDLRKRLCPGAEFVLLFSGRLEPVKRLDLLLQAWRDALAHDKKAWLVLAGEGDERMSLQEQAVQYGIADRVVFTGHVDRIVNYIHAADVLALVSDYEGLSNAMLEGMASGLPVLGSRISGTEDFVDEGRTGWLFEAGSLAGLTRQLSVARAIQPSELARMSRAAHDEVVTRASVQAVTRALLDAYANLSEKH